MSKKSKYRYEGYGVVRDTEIDFPYHTDDIVDLLDEKDQQISDLEAKLAEKDKENLTLFSMLHETLEKQGCENIASTIEQMTNLTLEKQSNWFKGNCVKEQDKISFAVEQLEKVKSVINTSVRDDHIIWDFDIKAHIDNQIKELKGEVYE